jgi:hypothetical protein
MPIELPAYTTATRYAETDAADEYALARGAAAWIALDFEKKEQALTAASIDIDTLPYRGSRASDDQELAWPRTDTEFSEDAWPRDLVRAAMELAFTYAPALSANASADPLANNRSGTNVKRKKVGPLETEYYAPPTSDADLTSVDRFPPIVQNLLQPLLAVMTTEPNINSPSTAVSTRATW